MHRGSRPIADQSSHEIQIERLSDVAGAPAALPSIVDVDGPPHDRESSGVASTSADTQRKKKHEITTVGIVTADRPRSLQRCLATLAPQVYGYNRSARIVVVDGSRAEANRGLNASAVAHLGQDTGLAVLYVGPSEARSLREHLSSTGVDASLLAFALTPGHVGANRNNLLLLTAGEHVLFVDDDVVAEPCSLPLASSDLSFGRIEDQEEHYFPNRRRALSAVGPSETNLLQAHADLMGHSLASLVASQPIVNRAGIDSALAHAWSEAPAYTIRATFAGIVGDSGRWCPAPVLFSRGKRRAHLLESEAAFDCALESREILRVVKNPTVTHEPCCTTYCMGLANTSVPPPFIPIGRHEDTLFGVMLGLNEPTSLFGHVAVGVFHDSSRPSYYTDHIASASITSASALVLALIDNGCGEQTLGGARQVLREIGALPIDELVRYVTRIVLERRTREIDEAEQSLPVSGHVANRWRQKLAEYRQTLLNNAAYAEFFIPPQLAWSDSVEDGFVRTQQFLNQFGELLDAWPTLWQSALSENVIERGCQTPR